MTDSALLNLLPPLRRARGDRLYAGQKHWVDLWKQDGSWLLGRRPEGAAKEWKIQLDKGLTGWTPSLWPRRLEALVPRLIPGVAAVRIFRNADRAPVLPVWRPWDGRLPSGDAWRLALPAGPAHAVAVAYGQGWKQPIPEHDATSPAEASSLVRAAADLLRLSADVRAVAARAEMAAAFDRHIAPTGLFRREGIWFSAVTDDYAGLFRALLEAGFLLNPDPDAPGVLAPLSDGEWATWKKAAEAWKEGRR